MTEQYKLSTYYRSIAPIKSAVEKSQVVSLDEAPRLFFLCGANGHDGNISYRRQQVLNFLKNNIRHSHIIIAEQFFYEYQKNSKTKNSLDFEHALSAISEKIIIILESSGAICELGAFSNDILRHKLIVINDKNFQHAPSFINTGPLAAIKEHVGDDKIIWYKMDDTIPYLDSIASTFLKLESLLSLGSTARTKISGSSMDPSVSISNTSVLFVHDIIFLLDKAKYKDLIGALKLIFGENKSFDNTKRILTILISLGFITYNESFSEIKSNRIRCFFKYTDNDARIKSGFFLSNLKKRMRSS